MFSCTWVQCVHVYSVNNIYSESTVQVLDLQPLSLSPTEGRGKGGQINDYRGFPCTAHVSQTVVCGTETKFFLCCSQLPVCYVRVPSGVTCFLDLQDHPDHGLLREALTFVQKVCSRLSPSVPL